MSAVELRQAAETERAEWGGAQNARNFPRSAAIHLALADWLDEVSVAFERDTIEDSIGCPSCGTACAGHPYALWHDSCGGAIESDYYTEDPCECFAKPLTIARLINGGAA